VKNRIFNWTAAAIAVSAALAILPGTGQAQEERAPQGKAGFAGKGKGKQRPKGGPIPRLADGKPNFDTHPGVWDVPYVTNMENASRWGGTDVKPPFNAKGKEVYEERVRNNAALDPEGYCLPPGIPRMMYTPYPMKMIQLPDRMYMIYEGGAHVWREIPIGTKEKLTHPEDPNPTYLGDSYAWWEGDAFVVDVVGFNDRTWLDFSGHPHGEKLHVVERYEMTDSLNLKYSATIEDPEYYTAPWTVTVNIPKNPDKRILEYICQENERDTRHLEEILRQGK
jgi:hypothetical protein